MKLFWGFGFSFLHPHLHSSVTMSSTSSYSSSGETSPEDIPRGGGTIRVYLPNKQRTVVRPTVCEADDCETTVCEADDWGDCETTVWYDCVMTVSSTVCVTTVCDLQRFKGCWYIYICTSNFHPSSHHLWIHTDLHCSTRVCSFSTDFSVSAPDWSVFYSRSMFAKDRLCTRVWIKLLKSEV